MEKVSADVSPGLRLKKEEKNKRNSPSGGEDNGITAFLWACISGHVQIAETFLAMGCDVNLSDNDGWSALMLACKFGHPQVLNLLVEYGADVHRIKVNDGDNALTISSECGHVEIVQLLLQLGAHFYHRNLNGRTALMLASQEGHVHIVKILLAHGADTQIYTDDGLNAFDLTQSQEIKDLIQGDLLALLSSSSSKNHQSIIRN